MNEQILDAIFPTASDLTATHRVLVTGAAGGIGQSLVRTLAAEPSIAAIIALDSVDPPYFAANLIFHRRDPLREVTSLFQLHQPDIVVHLATAQAAQDNRTSRAASALASYEPLFAACAAHAPGHLLLLSNASVYGAWPDNPPLLGEGAPLRPHPGDWAGVAFVKAEQLATQFERDHPASVMQIARAVPLVGPHMKGSLVRALNRRTLLTVNGCQPQLQFLHEDDLVEALLALLSSEASGVFNVSPDDAVPLSELGVHARSLPAALLRPLLSLGERLNLRSFSELSLAQTLELCYPLVLDNRKLRDMLNFQYTYTTRQAVAARAGTRNAENRAAS